MEFQRQLSAGAFNREAQQPRSQDSDGKRLVGLPNGLDSWISPESRYAIQNSHWLRFLAFITKFSACSSKDLGESAYTIFYLKIE